MVQWPTDLLADWLGGRVVVGVVVGFVVGCKWFLLSRIGSDEAWLTPYHSTTTISTHNGYFGCGRWR